jgi:ATP synthase F1 gamma subunit
MLPAVHIKRTIDFNRGFRSLLEVLKLVAVSEYHNLEKKLQSFDRLQTLLTEFFDSVDLSAVRHPFLEAGGRPGVVAVTSDAGLLGGLNMQVVTKAVELVRESNGQLVVIGERGLIYAQDQGVPFEYFPGVVDAKRYSQATQIRDHLTQKILKGEMGGLKVVYPRAVSFVVHRIETATLVPFTPEPSAAAAVPPGSSASPADRPASAGKLRPQDETILESSAADVVEYLVYLLLGQRFYEIFGMARVCEQAARYLHLEESCNKISEMNKKLLLQYFRRRHEIIDANMRELFSARNIFAK